MNKDNMATLRAFHDSPDLKKFYIDRVIMHRKLDELVQGTGWEANGKTRGCAVGCTLNVCDHDRYPIELGIPQVLARLEDRLFELMPRKDAIGATPAEAWPFRFLNAINPGADLSHVWPQWAVWMLVDPDHGVIRHAKRPATIEAINRVAQLWREGGTSEQFRQARSAAYSAARAAYADAAAYAADADAAYAADAADAADAAYAAAAYSAARATARAADAAAYQKARGKWAIVAADKLIELLESAW